MDAIYVDAESHGYYGDDEPPESVVLVGESGSIEYVLAGEYHWLRDFLNGIAEKCGTKDCPSLVKYVRQLEGEVDELREQVASLTDRSFRMADKMDCLNAENESLRELVRDMWEGYNDPRCEECHLKDTPTCADCPICAREASVIDRMHELGVGE